jgi:trimeric autotransporter adhesin
MQRTWFFAALMLALSVADATPWTYRGTLNDGGKPANGNYDLRLTLMDDTVTRAVVQPITLYNVMVRNGEFSVDADFGIDLGNASSMKLKTEVGQGGAGFATLGEPTLFDPKAALAGMCWDTTGNVVAAGEFLGATNNVPLLLRANNKAVFSAYPSVASPNLLAGYEGNTVSPAFSGQTIAGGGEATRINRTSNDFATVGGGRNNRAEGLLATVSGGSSNKALGEYSAVGGGFGNCAGGDYSWAGGTGARVRDAGDTLGTCNAGESGDADGDEGVFIWNDHSSDNQFGQASTGPNQFLIRAHGGFALNGTPADNTEVTIFSPQDSQAVELVLSPNRSTGESIQLSADIGTVGDTNDAQFRILQRDLTGVAGSNILLLLKTNRDLNVYADAFKPGGGAWSVSSDARLKQDVTPLSGSLDRLLALRGVNFRYRDDAPKDLVATGPQIGFIAQELEQVFPQWIGEAEGYKTIGIKGFEALTVEALRDLKVESEARIEILQQENAEVRARLDAIEARLAK